MTTLLPSLSLESLSRNLTSAKIRGATITTPWAGATNQHFIGLALLSGTLIPQFTYGSLPRRALFTLHLLFLLQAAIAFPPLHETNTAVLYTTGMMFGIALARSIDRLWLRVPEEAFHRLVPQSSVNAKEKPLLVKEDARSLSRFSRWLWALELAIVARGVGWDWCVSNVPKHSSLSKQHFLSTRILKWVAMYAALTIVSTVTQEMLSEFPSVKDTTLRSKLLALSQNTWVQYVWITIGWDVTIYSHFGLLMLPFGFLCVGLQLGPRAWRDVEAWPPNFGDVTQAYSIRRLWGVFWHQQLRRVIGVPGALILAKSPSALQKSKSQPARLFKRYFLLMSAFIVSGAIHTSGIYNVTHALRLPTSYLDDIIFYCLQGFGIILEDFVCYIIGVDDQANAPSTMRRTIGYVITLAFHIWTRTAYKAIPLSRASGFKDERGGLYAALKHMQVGSSAVPGNVVNTVWQRVSSE